MKNCSASGDTPHKDYHSLLITLVPEIRDRNSGLFPLKSDSLFCWTCRDLDLKKPIYQKTACYGHFGRNEFPWEVPKKLVF